MLGFGIDLEVDGIGWDRCDGRDAVLGLDSGPNKRSMKSGLACEGRYIRFVSLNYY